MRKKSSTMAWKTFSVAIRTLFDRKEAEMDEKLDKAKGKVKNVLKGAKKSVKKKTR